MSKLFGENGCLKDRYGTVCIYLHGRGQGIDCTNAAATSRIQSRVLGIDMLQAKKIESYSLIFKMWSIIGNPPMFVI